MSKDDSKTSHQHLPKVSVDTYWASSPCPWSLQLPLYSWWRDPRRPPSKWRAAGPDCQWPRRRSPHLARRLLWRRPPRRRPESTPGSLLSGAGWSCAGTPLPTDARASGTASAYTIKFSSPDSSSSRFVFTNIPLATSRFSKQGQMRGKFESSTYVTEGGGVEEKRAPKQCSSCCIAFYYQVCVLLMTTHDILTYVRYSLMAETLRLGLITRSSWAPPGLACGLPPSD